MIKEIDYKEINFIELNRSWRLEGKEGFYNGKKVTSRYVALEPINNEPPEINLGPGTYR